MARASKWHENDQRVHSPLLAAGVLNEFCPFDVIYYPEYDIRAKVFERDADNGQLTSQVGKLGCCPSL